MAMKTFTSSFMLKVKMQFLVAITTKGVVQLGTHYNEQRSASFNLRLCKS
jgi:hypothetical protein